MSTKINVNKRRQDSTELSATKKKVKKKRKNKEQGKQFSLIY